LNASVEVTGSSWRVAVSQALHMWPRTLQRRPQDSGSGFQRVLDEARHQMAWYYLSNSALELNEAAYLLGSEDPNSFGRAFRNWKGIPPSDWRETPAYKGDVISFAQM
jgi:AraC-like DNA-binding protein